MVINDFKKEITDNIKKDEELNNLILIIEDYCEKNKHPLEITTSKIIIYRNTEKLG